MVGGRIRLVKRSRRSKRPKVLPTGSPLPRHLESKLRYFDELTMASGSGIIDTEIYRANDVGDPYVGVSTKQPRAYDQIVAAGYKKSLVRSSRMEFKIQSLNGGSSIYGIAILPTLTPLTTLVDYMECRDMVYQVVGNSNATNLLTLRSRWSISKFAGVKNPMGDDELSGLTSTTAATSTIPVKHWYYHIFYIGLGGINAGTQYTTVLLDYNTTFHDVQQPGPS